MADIAVIILAAGASTRMKTAKQLLPVGPRTLLRQAVDAAVESVASTTVVVLGANAETIREKLPAAFLIVVENTRWQEGIGSSIRTGIEWLLANRRGIEGVVIMVCDQPHVSAQVINRLIDTFQTCNKRMVASSYGNTLGVPALFGAQCFGDLLKLSPETGAKGFLLRHLDAVAAVGFPDGEIDLDTPADYDRFRQRASAEFPA